MMMMMMMMMILKFIERHWLNGALQEICENSGRPI